jgi:hypothetical protein
MADIVSIEGPVELHNGQLILRIPLVEGGDKLAPFVRGIGQVEGDDLVVVIQPWLGQQLGIAENNIL